MARKRHSDEDVLKLLREIELKLAADDARSPGFETSPPDADLLLHRAVVIALDL